MGFAFCVPTCFFFRNGMTWRIGGKCLYLAECDTGLPFNLQRMHYKRHVNDYIVLEPFDDLDKTLQINVPLWKLSPYQWRKQWVRFVFKKNYILLW